MNTIERLKAIKEHFENISIEEFEQNLIKAGMNENKHPESNSLIRKIHEFIFGETDGEYNRAIIIAILLGICISETMILIWK